MGIDLSFFESDEFRYLLLIVGLFIVPRALQRFRLPSAVTCVAIGAFTGMGLHALHDDTTVPLLGSLGIISMFLFAGLEVDFSDLQKGKRILAQHLLIQAISLVFATFVLEHLLGLGWRSSILVALALGTPSTGFILDSLPSFGLPQDQAFWVKSKAIAVELVALIVLFVTVQSGSALELGVSAGVLIGMILLLPPVFRMFATRILPWAPKSEFAFLLIVALVCAAITRHLGVYYLVGAFVVGVTAQRFRKVLPGVASDRLLHAVELFASFFIPFYFFKAGLHLSPEDFSPLALGFGVLAVLVAVPLRVGLVAIHRALALKVPMRTAAKVGASLVPTLVFTIVIANILRDRFDLPPHLYGALIVYTLLNTVIPGFVLGTPTPEFDAPTIVTEPPK